MADKTFLQLEHLPHQDPFRFVSKIHQIVAGNSAKGQWVVSGREEFFAGHFPGDPIVPGVLIGESLAQISGLVLFQETATSFSARLAHLDLKLTHAVRPPAEINLESTLTKAMGDLSLFAVRATCSGMVVALGSLTLQRMGHEVPQ